jgi:replicative DNA helicase
VTGPLPPWDEQAERVLLGSMLLDGRALAEALALVAERDLYSPRHQTVYAAISALAERGHPVDHLTVGAELLRRGEFTGDGGPGVFLLDLTRAVPTASNVQHWAELVTDAGERRRGIEAAAELQQKLYARGTDVAEVIRAAVERLNGVGAGRAGSRATMMPLADVQPERLTWLWPGRIPAGKLVVLDGDPSVGKSTVAIDWAARVSTGSPWPDRQPCARGAVVILSAEDDPADTIRPASTPQAATRTACTC